MFWCSSPTQHGPVPSNHSAIGGLASTAAPSSPPPTAQTTVWELLTNWSELATPQFIAQPWTLVKQQQNIKAHKRKRKHSFCLCWLSPLLLILSFTPSVLDPPLTLDSLSLSLPHTHTHTQAHGRQKRGVCAIYRLSHCVMLRNQSEVKLTPPNELLSEPCVQGSSGQRYKHPGITVQRWEERKKVNWTSRRANWNMMDVEMGRAWDGWMETDGK